MAFANRLLIFVPGAGIPVQNDALFLSQANVLAIGSTTVTLAGLTPPVKGGWVRLKMYGGTAGSTLTSIVVTATDGTTTERIFSETVVGSPSIVSPNTAVRTIPFLSELSVTSMSFIVVVGTAAAVLDVEIGASN